MDFMLLLLGLVMTAIVFSVRGILSGSKQPSTRRLAPQPLLASHSIDHCRPLVTPKGELPSISIRECETLAHTSEGVLFVTVTETGERRPFPFHNTYSLVMTPRQLVSELRWFPSTSFVVLWGDTAPCSSVIELLGGVPKVPPIFVLRDAPSRWEVAQVR